VLSAIEMFHDIALYKFNIHIHIPDSGLTFLTDADTVLVTAARRRWKTVEAAIHQF